MPSFLHLLIPLLIVLFFILVLLVVIRINTIVHEAGHALAMHRLVNGRITVFLGSYGNKAESWLIRWGRFDIWFRKNPLRWWGGLCMHEEQEVSRRSQALYILAGPLASLLVCLIAVAAFIGTRAEGLLAPLMVLVCVYTLLDFLANIIPRDVATIVNGNRISYNDGKRLQELYMLPRMPAAWFEAVGHYQAGISVGLRQSWSS